MELCFSVEEFLKHFNMWKGLLRVPFSGFMEKCGWKSCISLSRQLICQKCPENSVMLYISVYLFTLVLIKLRLNYFYQWDSFHQLFFSFHQLLILMIACMHCLLLCISNLIIASYLVLFPFYRWVSWGTTLNIWSEPFSKQKETRILQYIPLYLMFLILLESNLPK